MEPTAYERVAHLLAALGAIGSAVGVANILTLRTFRTGLVSLDDIPAPMRVRIRWWTRHNPAFLAASGLALLAGLTMLAAG